MKSTRSPCVDLIVITDPQVLRVQILLLSQISKVARWRGRLERRTGSRRVDACFGGSFNFVGGHDGVLFWRDRDYFESDDGS